MTDITRTSPLHLGEIRKTQRRVAALLRVPDQFNVYIGRRRRHTPSGFCYVCSHLDPRGRGGGGPNNPYRHLFSKGYLKPCPHLTPAAPHPTFIGSDGAPEEDEGDDDFADDGFDEESWDLEGSEDGALFDTAILRDELDQDPRMFSLPPVFGKPGEQQLKQKRRSKNSRLVPVVSEKTFLSTNKRAQGQNGDPDPKQSRDLRLPKLSNQQGSLVSENVSGGQGDRHRKQRDPRRLHSERIDRREAESLAERSTRSDSALGAGRTKSNTDLNRELTDPPPQPIVVSIRNQDGEVVHRTPLDRLPPGAIPTEAFVDQRGQRQRKKREKKRRPRSRDGSASPSFSGSITISRETTLSGLDSPDYFLSRLRSASWCECPDHVPSESRCGECRRVRDHEKWCVSRNTVCHNCGKPFKRKYSQLERKSSFNPIPASGMTVNSIPHSASPSKSRHQNCSPTKTSKSPSQAQGGAGAREPSGTRVRFNEAGEVVFPQWDAALPDSGVEEEDHPNQEEVTTTKEGQPPPDGSERPRRSYLPSVDADIHQRAYNMALADAKLRTLTQRKMSKRLQHPKGIYFSYFPLLKRGRHVSGDKDPSASPTPPLPMIGLRADVREGKQLKVKKGLKHILGDVKLDDYYPGGKRYPKDLS